MKKSEIRRRSMRLLLIGGSSVVLVAAGGLVDGFITHRWTGSDLLANASASVGSLPKVIGEWESEELEISDQILAIAGATGHTKRVYHNRNTGEWIGVTFLCGDHGPISLHPPTVCFTGSGWTAVKQEEVAEYTPRSDVRAATWQAAFRKRADFEEQVIVADWSWNDGSGWKAADKPRYQFAGAPYLFKLYVVSDVELMDDDSGKQRREAFVNALLNEIDQTVFISLSTNNKQDGSVEQ